MAQNISSPWTQNISEHNSPATIFRQMEKISGMDSESETKKLNSDFGFRIYVSSESNPNKVRVQSK